MYECPIIITMMRDFTEKQMIERDNAITLKIQEKIGIDIDKKELIKALNYDRQQYEKGYADAKAEFAPKWIKVEDGLPETHEDSRSIYRERSDEVMCIFKDGEDVFNSCGYLIEHADGHKEWRTDCYMSDDGEVIAWMPIPKYEIESED